MNKQLNINYATARQQIPLRKGGLERVPPIGKGGVRGIYSPRIYQFVQGSVSGRQGKIVEQNAGFIERLEYGPAERRQTADDEAVGTGGTGLTTTARLLGQEFVINLSVDTLHFAGAVSDYRGYSVKYT